MPRDHDTGAERPGPFLPALGMLATLGLLAFVAWQHGLWVLVGAGLGMLAIHILIRLETGHWVEFTEYGSRLRVSEAPAPRPPQRL